MKTTEIHKILRSDRNDRSKALSIAWYIRRELTLSWSICQRFAWSYVRKGSFSSLVKLTFVKKDEVEPTTRFTSINRIGLNKYNNLWFEEIGAERPNKSCKLDRVQALQAA